MIRKVVRFINVPRYVTCHVMGKEHTTRHHRIAGTITIFIGAILIKLSLITGNGFIHFFGEIIGWSMHAVGMAPFIEERLEKKLEMVEELTKKEEPT